MKRGLIEEKRTISSDDPWLPEYLGYAGTDPYNHVNAASGEAAMKISAVYRCVSILSGTIAALPLYPRRKGGKGEFAIDYGSPLYPLLKWKANDNLSAYQMLESAIVEILLHGKAYIFPKYRKGEVYELVLLERGSVYFDDYSKKYTINDYKNDVSGEFDSWRVICVQNKMGVSTIQYAARILNISANADEQTLANMRNGNKEKGFLTGGTAMAGMGTVQDEQVDKVAERLMAQLSNGESIMRLPGELQWQPYSISPADAQILENRKFGVFEICRFFGVHPDKVFVEQTSNYKASENSQTSFMTDTLQPLLSQIESELTIKLMPQQLVGRVLKIEFDRVALYQLDPAGASTYYKNMFEVGGLTTNEIRLAENKAPVEGGDVAFVTANVAPITSDKIYGRKPESEEAKEKGEEADTEKDKKDSSTEK